MSFDWQLALVLIIELAALAFIVSRFWSRRPRRSKGSSRPDVPVSRLTRKKNSS